MGREVRRVPPNWEHPKKDCTHSPWNGGCAEAKRDNGLCYQPLYDEDFEDAMQNWLDTLDKWMKGEFAKVRAEHPDLDYKEAEPYRALVDWSGGPPDPEYYRPKWKEGEATWYQLYETVSEGTPVTPPFETEEEVAQYLAEHGDFWYQNDQLEPSPLGTFRTKPTIEQARSLVKTGWAMSLMVERTAEGVTMRDAYQQQDAKIGL